MCPVLEIIVRVLAVDLLDGGWLESRVTERLGQYIGVDKGLWQFLAVLGNRHDWYWASEIKDIANNIRNIDKMAVMSGLS